jgi:hypothetical protein
MDSAPELLDILRRFTKEPTYVGVINLQCETSRLLAEIDGSEASDWGVVAMAPRTLVAGPRRAVYLAAEGARVVGTTQVAKVFHAIEQAGPLGKTSDELRQQLDLKPKSLESVLYRLRLAECIRSYDAGDIRAL